MNFEKIRHFVLFSDLRFPAMAPLSTAVGGGPPPPPPPPNMPSFPLTLETVEVFAKATTAVGAAAAAAVIVVYTAKRSRAAQVARMRRHLLKKCQRVREKRRGWCLRGRERVCVWGR